MVILKRLTSTRPLFLVESDEALLSDQTVLQELEIDINQIQKTLKYMLTHVWLVIYVYFNPRYDTTVKEHPLAGKKNL